MIAGCPTDSDSARDTTTKIPVRAQYGGIVSCDPMGDVWADAGCPASARSIWSNIEGSRALIMLRGGTSALWYDSGNLESVELGRKPAWVNAALGVAYAIGDSEEGKDDLVLKRSLPQGEWEQVFSCEDAYWDGLQIRSITGHPASSMVSLLVSGMPEYKPLDIDPATLEGDARQLLEEYRSLPPTSSKYPEIKTGQLTGDDEFKTESFNVSGSDDTSDIHIAVLADGTHLTGWGNEILELTYAIQENKDYQLVADVTDAQVFWVYIKPSQSGKGTGRDAPGSQPGGLFAINTDCELLGKMPVGTLEFNTLACDWANRRALLADPAYGVALADFEQYEFSWLMRNNGEVPLFLLPGGQTWALLDKGIVRLGVDELIALKPKLAASEVLNRDDIELIKPVAEALGWGWPDTQISPLLTYTDRMTFFDAGGMDASLAEFDWDAGDERVSRLLIAREPTGSDLNLLAMDNRGLATYLNKTLLPLLGWPGVECDISQRAQDEDERQVTAALTPDEQSTGEFQLWITTGAMLMTLGDGGNILTEEPPVETLAEDEEPALANDAESTP